MNDKFIEQKRYDRNAQNMLSTGAESDLTLIRGSEALPVILRSPYILYERIIKDRIKPGSDVLEIGAGTGLHTHSLVKTGAKVVATDISIKSLEVLERCVGSDVITQVADMESLPFADNSFDVVACAGSLSYGEPELVDAEIRRVLRPGGLFLSVDSLNHNPVYRLNRWVHYLRGNRSRSVVRRIPDLARIHSIGNGFANVETKYFGAFSFVMPLVARIVGSGRAQILSDRIDRIINVKRLAFKYVLVASGLSK